MLAKWIASSLKADQVLHVDLSSGTYKLTSDIFHTFRPDIVIVDFSKCVTLKLTVCNEINLTNSKKFKSDKYASLFEHLTDR